jgi:hypothetical protein
MLLNILKTPKDLQLSKWSKDPTHISKSIYSYNNLQYGLACAMKWCNMYIIA